MTDLIPSVATEEEKAEFEVRLARAREDEPEPVLRQVDGKNVIWAPQEGSQVEFLSCPLFEVLYHGTRGGGKTTCLIMSFAQHVGKGYGAAWCGVIIRKTYPQLSDVVRKSEIWFRSIFPRAKFNKASMTWTWPTGEVLQFRHMARPEDSELFLGHELPFIGWEELTNWNTDECFKRLIACCRSSTKNMPRMIRSTTNPYGVGSNWIKSRYELAGNWWKTIVIENPVNAQNKPERPRCSIHSHLDENKILTEADPFYKDVIASSATNDAMAAAWMHGSWDVTCGGMFDDVWNPNYNIIPEFNVPPSWRLDRSFDWGSSHPFSMCWWAESDGTDFRTISGQWRSSVPGDLVMVREWYGWNGRPNQGVHMLAVDMAKGVVEREVKWGWRNQHKSLVHAGPADTNIYKVENGVCMADEMMEKVRVDGGMYKGVSWTRADKRKDTRVLGWQKMREMIVHAKPKDNLPREYPGLFIMDNQCPQFLRTVLSLPRDEKNLDDIVKTSENHIADAVRYRCRSVGTTITSGTTIGMF